MSAPAEQRLTPQQYLELERAAEHRSEFLHGCVFAMAGASRAHNLITLNLASEFRARLRDSSCEVYANDMRVKVAPTRLYTYPDVMVACGELRFEDGHEDTLLNPQVIVEVLSPSTASRDFEDKFTVYKALPTFCEYLLVAQDEPRVTHCIRQADGTWTRADVLGLDATLSLAGVVGTLFLREIYRDVEREVEVDQPPAVGADPIAGGKPEVLDSDLPPWDDKAR